MGSEEKLHRTPPRSHSSPDVPVPWFQLTQTRLVLFSFLGITFIYSCVVILKCMQLCFLHVLQVILASSWTPWGRTSCATALMTTSTCSMSLDLKPAQVRKGSIQISPRFQFNSLLRLITRWGCKLMRLGGTETGSREDSILFNRKCEYART